MESMRGMSNLEPIWVLMDIDFFLAVRVVFLLPTN